MGEAIHLVAIRTLRTVPGGNQDMAANKVYYLPKGRARDLVRRKYAVYVASKEDAREATSQIAEQATEPASPRRRIVGESIMTKRGLKPVKPGETDE